MLAREYPSRTKRGLFMKKVLMLAVFAAAAFSQAADSPEVLFATNVISGSINRFDPITGASFGSFGGGILTSPMGIAVDGFAKVYVSDIVGSFSVIRVFNGFTGNYLGQLGASRTDIIGGLTIGPDGYLYGSTTPNSFGAAGGLIKVDRNTGVTNYLAIAGSVNPTDVAYGVSSIYVNAVNKSYQINPGSFTVTNSFATLVDTTFLHFDQNRAGWMQGGRGPQWGVGVARPSIYDSIGGAIALSGGVSVSDMANGHTLMYAGIRTGAGNSLIQRYDPTNKLFIGTFGAQTGDAYGALACYNAPEPGSFIALGAGAAVLAIRRRRRATN